MTERAKKAEALSKLKKAAQDLELYINSLNHDDLTISQSDYDMWIKRLQSMKDSIPWLEAQLEVDE